MLLLKYWANELYLAAILMEKWWGTLILRKSVDSKIFTFNRQFSKTRQCIQK